MTDMTTPQKLAADLAAAGFKPSQKLFDSEFTARLRELDRRAKAIGVSWSSICRATGTARATPDRWMRRPPKSVETLAAMEKFIAEQEVEAAQDRF